MGAGIHGGFGNTAGALETTYKGASLKEITYSERGIDVPETVKSALSKLTSKGDYFTYQGNEFSMKDVSIISKESGVEFAQVTIGDKKYLIRGDKRGAEIPKELLTRMKTEKASFDFHSHPHNDDCIPSKADLDAMSSIKRLTGQKYSTIITPNGRTSKYNENGVIETGTVSNALDENHKRALLKLFGGK